VSHINDAIRETTGGPTVNDGFASWFGKLPDESIQDAEHRWLTENGATSGHINDMWFEFLRSSGYTGALSDMLYQYWAAGGGGGTNPWPEDDLLFIGAYKGETDAQNVDSNGNVCNMMPLGIGQATTVHADVEVPDHEGVARKYPANMPVWKGGRQVAYPFLHNRDITQAAVWSTNQCNILDHETCSRTGAEQWGFLRYTPAVAPIVDDYVILSFEVRSDDTTQFTIDQFFEFGKSITISPEWTRYSFDGLVKGSLIRFYADQGTTEDRTFQIRNIMYEVATFRTNKFHPSEIMEVNGIPLSMTYATQNDNHADPTTRVVTEAEGPLFNPVPFLATDAVLASDGATPVIFSCEYPEGNIIPWNSYIHFTLECKGESTGNILVLGALILKYVVGAVELTDGTNTSSVPITAGIREITILLASHNMGLIVDGVSDSDTYVPVAASNLVMHKNHWWLRSKEAVPGALPPGTVTHDGANVTHEGEIVTNT